VSERFQGQAKKKKKKRIRPDLDRSKKGVATPSAQTSEAEEYRKTTTNRLGRKGGRDGSTVTQGAANREGLLASGKGGGLWGEALTVR